MTKKRHNLFPILLITIVVIACAPLLLWIRSNPPLALQVFDNAVYNLEISYQVTALAFAVIVIGIVFGLTGRDGLAYLNLKKLDGTIRPEPWIGIKPKESETWRHLGLNFAVVITLVTAVVIYFQVVHGGRVSLELYPGGVDGCFYRMVPGEIDVGNEGILLGAGDSFLAGCYYF